MSSHGTNKTDMKLNIFSPRPKPPLLTSISRVIAPTKFSPVYTFTEQNSILHHQTGNVKPPEYASNSKSPDKKVEHDMHTGDKGKLVEQNPFFDGIVSKINIPLQQDYEDTQQRRNISNRMDENESPLMSIERQIIVDTTPHTDREIKSPDVTYHQNSSSLSDGLSANVVCNRRKGSKDKSIKTQTETPVWEGEGLPGYTSHLSSVSGNSVIQDSDRLSSPRCSVCDGCSSTSSSCQAVNVSSLTLQGDRSRTFSGQSTSSTELLNEVCKGRRHDECLHYLSGNECCLDVMDTCVHNLSPTVTPDQHSIRTQTGCLGQAASKPDCVRQCDTPSTQNTLGNIVVLSMWVQLSKYRELQIENTKQKKSMSDYERKIDSLVLSVLVLSKQMKTSLYKLQTVQGQLHQLKDQQYKNERKLRRVYIGMGCVVCLLILQVNPVKRQCLSLIQYFGLFEILEKINRTRKMVSDNWRNIPSLLTDFWRIFIFRSRSRLKDRFS